jgi:hypothetical protein
MYPVPPQRRARWRCRQCGAERAAAWRRRRRAVAWATQLHWCKEFLSNRPQTVNCRSGKSLLAACTQIVQHSRAEAGATLFRPIEKVSKETDVHSGDVFMRKFHVSQHPQVYLVAL